MLFNFKWLEPGQPFPPTQEVHRIERYRQNATLFGGGHFHDDVCRSRDHSECGPIEVFSRCARRISTVVGNFEDVVSFPVLLNYQRLMSLKMADLTCGEAPSITGASAESNSAIKKARDLTDFNAKLYSTAIDISRYGDAIWRIYKDEQGHNNFTCWNPSQWFPVVAQDGTCSIKVHCICWRENISEDPEKPVWILHVQKHDCTANGAGRYMYEQYSMNSSGDAIMDRLSRKTVFTGLNTCAIIHLKAFSTTGSVYGYDDYMNIDSIMAEIMVRVGQISAILDKHADPNMTGPVSMLRKDPHTGELALGRGKFYATSPGEEQPKYLTWDGQLSSAFKQLELLINQLYILSEMGSALLGSFDGGSNVISGTAMRFKMVNPLSKARRVANSMTYSVRKLFESLSGVDANEISVSWYDGLPDDPREAIENAKLASGQTQLMPLEYAIMEFFSKSNEEAKTWMSMIEAETAGRMQLISGAQETVKDPNHPGPQDGTGVNSSKKGSVTGLNEFGDDSN